MIELLTGNLLIGGEHLARIGKRANGSHKKRLTHSAAWDYSPSFSPSGKKLVFARFVYRKRNDLYTIRRDGTQLKRLTHLPYVGESVFGPQFSPNGRSIVFTHGAQYRISIIRSNGSHRRVLADPPGSGHDLWPDFSPSGRRIVFQRGTRSTGAIYLMTRNGTQLRNVGSHYGRNPAFSPSGKRIVFARKTTGERLGALHHQARRLCPGGSVDEQKRPGTELGGAALMS